MNTRRATRASVRYLTNEKITRAILSNAIEEGNNSGDENSEEEEVDEITNNEEDADYEPDENAESKEGIEEEEEKGEARDDTNEAAASVSSNGYIGRDQIEWNAQPIDYPDRFRHLQIQSKVVLPPGKRLDSALDCFRIIFDNAVLNIIVRYTNIEAKKYKQNWKDIDKNELMAYIGLLIIEGVDRSSKRNYNEFFNRLRGLPIFRATMSRDRFKDFLRFVRFEQGCQIGLLLVIWATRYSNLR